MDDGGMSIRLDPRRLGALKLLAAEAGVRPGELVTRWVEERLDAARAGGAPSPSIAPDALAVLNARIDELFRRFEQLSAQPAEQLVPSAAQAAGVAEAPVKRGPGRPRKVSTDATATNASQPKVRAVRRASAKRTGRASSKVALHDEITAVISERGPQTAAELAVAIAERGRYLPPRSAKPLDAATVNARVSNPTYRGRFVRREHRIGLAVE
jgi:hypothetical protein